MLESILFHLREKKNICRKIKLNYNITPAPPPFNFILNIFPVFLYGFKKEMIYVTVLVELLIYKEWEENVLSMSYNWG